MAARGKKGHISLVRHVAQLLFAVLFAAPLLVAGWNLMGMTPATDSSMATPAQLPFYGTLSSSTVLGIEIMDPFAFLETVCASKSFDVAWLVAALPPLLVYGLIRGRVFCGWVCPVNLVCEIVDFIRRKLKLKTAERAVPRHAKLYIALAVLALSALLSIPVFEAFSPLNVLGKGLALGSVAGVVTLVAIVVADLFFGHRVWCRSICPLGGFYEALGKVGLVNIKIDHDACIHCGACERSCICDPEILKPAVEGDDNAVKAGDCMLCGKCVDTCPSKALKVGIGR